jgi:LysR family hydrogen peroxide-inducible transcriptional activator
MLHAPHPFTLRQLQYVIAVADELSFRRAAERCHVSQPSLSTQLTQVERALGVRLFERSRKRVLVTTIGRDFVDRAHRLLRDADDLAQSARRATDPFSGTMRIGILPTISPYLLPRVTAHLRSALSRLRIAWVEERTEALLRKLDDGELDGAILALEAGIGAVEKEVIATDPFFLVAPPGHPLAAKRTPVSAVELRGEEMLLLNEGHCLRDQVLEVCKSSRAKEGEFRAASLSTLVQMVAGGAGVTLIPAMALEVEATRAGLRVRPVAEPSAHRTVAFVWRKGASAQRVLRAVAVSIRDGYRGSSSKSKRP